MGKSQILPSSAQRSFWGDACFQLPHLMHQTHPRTTKGDVVTSGIFLLHVSPWVRCLGHSTCVRTGGQLAQSHFFLSTVGVPGLNSGPQAWQQGPLLMEPSCWPKIPTFLKTTTETGREAGKGPPAWGEVRLCQRYIHEQFEKTNTFQGVLKAQTRPAILFFHQHLLF